MKFTRTLGRGGPQVGAMGLGCMGMSDLYGPADRATSLTTIHAALDSGMTLLDTGDFYGSGHNELLIGEVLRTRARDAVQVSVKFGALRDPAGGWVGLDNRPPAIANFLAYSLRRLGTDYIDIYRPARLDPGIPIEETVGAMARMVTAGYIRHIGLSEVGAANLRRAVAVHPIIDLQTEYSLFSRNMEKDLLPTCRELGVGITAYGVLSRGLLSGHWTRDRAPRDFRGILPRFRGDNLGRNLELVEALRRVAESRGVTVAQVAIGWVLSRGEDILPLIGARNREQLDEALAAETLQLGPADLAAIEDAVPAGAVSGARYHDQGMAGLDSERP